MTLARYARINGVLVALVPVRPNAAMLNAGRYEVSIGVENEELSIAIASDTYRAMLQNAPAVEVPAPRSFAFNPVNPPATPPDAEQVTPVPLYEIEFLEELPK